MRQRVLTHAALVAVLLVAWLAYKPGLGGGFLFDDFANLPSLGSTGPIDNGPALARYLTSGIADPTGRPIVVASFLIDAQDWPAVAWPFKRSNLIIHLLNILLLAGLLLKLGQHSSLSGPHAHRAAVLGAALWGMHPFFVSTTLYIVQREAMLPVTFTLAGLLLWLSGRQRLTEGRILSGTCLELTGIGLGTLLATLSKANGALLPIYVLLIEFVLLRPNDRQPLPLAHRKLTWLLWLPTAAIFAYLLHTAIQLLGGPPPFGRDWTLDQRLLTEPRVLWEYLRLLWLPRPFTSGLFNDQIQVSTGLLQPWATLPAIVGLCILIATAWLVRRRWPFWSFAVLFFFAGHLIESSTIPLELYFEHRNYLPALVMFWPLAIWLLAPGQASKARLLLALIILLGLGLMTHARARVWGDTTEQALLWAQLNPESPRAQTYAAQIMIERGQTQWAESKLRPMLRQTPHEIQIVFNLIGVDCAHNGVPTEDLIAAREALAQTRRLTTLSFDWLGDAIEQAKTGRCPGLTLSTVESLLDAAWSNPTVRSTPGWQQSILNLRGKLALARKQPQAAYRYFVDALLIKPYPDNALSQAAALGLAGQQKLAICELEFWESRLAAPPVPGWSMPRLHAWVLQKQKYWPNEIAHLKMELSQDMPIEQHNIDCPAVVPPR